MGLEWGLEQIHPTTRQTIRGTVFDPHWDPFTLDLMLTGEDEGPVEELVASGETGCDHDRPDLDWSSHVCPPAVIPVEAVRRCAMRLSGTIRSGYASPDTLFNGRLRGYSPSEQQALYDDLVDCADELRRFIAESARRGHALRCSMH